MYLGHDIRWEGLFLSFGGCGYGGSETRDRAFLFLFLFQVCLGRPGRVFRGLFLVFFFAGVYLKAERERERGSIQGR